MCRRALVVAGCRDIRRSVRPARHDDVLDVGADGQSEVGRQRPGRGRPRQGTDTGEPQALRLHADERERDGDRGVLPHLVDVVVHAQLVVRQRSLIPPAVGQHAVPLVGEALVPELLERPEHRLHVARVERLVAAFEVDPARLAGDVVLPLLRVLEHRLAGLRVEGSDPHLLDLALLGDAELLHGLELSGKAVRVPAEDAVDFLAPHRLEAREEVLRVSGQQVSVVRQSVGERRAVVEDPLLGAVALRDRRAEGVVARPEVEHVALDRGKARARRHVGGGPEGARDAGGGVRRGTGVAHVTPAGARASDSCSLPARTIVRPRYHPACRHPSSATHATAVTGLPRAVLVTPGVPWAFFRELPGDGRIGADQTIIPGA